MTRPRAAERSSFELRLLGPLEVEVGGRPLAIAGLKPKALLVLLALDAGRVVSVDRLVEEIWPAATPARASHSVKQYVFELRKALGRGAIATVAAGYVLALEPEQIDARRFERVADDGRALLHAGDAARAAEALRDALATWRGPALADFLYEPWAQAEIARLEELRLTAVEDRVEAELALGLHARLVAELEALLASNRLRERPRGQLMLALYRSGRQPDALAVYREGRNVLRDELGIEPGPELRALEAAILRQEESLLLAAPAAPAVRTRRLVTVVSVDVEAVGEPLDPEVEQRALDDAAAAATAALARHGGAASRAADGSLTAAFGVPSSREDDALRAALAAIEARGAVAAASDALGGRSALEARLGLECGEALTGGGSMGGRPARAAVRLRQGAAAGEIVVGEAAARRVEHAATLRARGDGSFLLEQVAVGAPAFARRLDSPLVGRRRELGTLRAALQRCAEERAPRAVTVVGPAGIGKSRLALELARTAKQATVISGRCASYGEAITYWPLRGLLADACRDGGSAGLLAVLAGEDDAEAVADRLLGAVGQGEAASAPGEIGWAFRRLCDVLARRRPLVLVLDDLHWAEPAFLDLVEQLADGAANAPILIVALGREELLEDRPDFLAGRERAELLVLPPLTAAETDALLDRLAAAAPPEQRARVAEAAEGNPLFVEQLLAHAAEGGLAGERQLPATIHALLAARLDRLGPGERAVLGRASVIGREFGLELLRALLEPAAAATASRHLQKLADRGFVRAADSHSFRFCHVLLQEAAYRAAPKAERASDHERLAELLGRNGAAEGGEELLGYHLEQAHRLRLELGPPDARARRLADDAGRYLGESGVRALKRGDMTACVNLLGRATVLLATEDPRRRELLCELGVALRTFGDAGSAREALAEAVALARGAGDRRVELRARIELGYVRLLTESGATGDELLDLAGEAFPVFEASGDERALGRTWLLVGFVQGGIRGRNQAWLESAERALEHNRRCGWPIWNCLGEIAGALLFGPVPVPEALARCSRLLREEASTPADEATLLAFTGALEAQAAAFDTARDLLGRAKAIYLDLGQRIAAANTCDALLADVELLAGNAAEAASILRALCATLQQVGDRSHLASRAGDLAGALLSCGTVEEARTWADVAEAHTASDDLDARAGVALVRARLAVGDGRLGEAEAAARDAVALVAATDNLNEQAGAASVLGDVLLLRGREAEAKELLDDALRLYERKGNLAAAALVRGLATQSAPA